MKYIWTLLLMALGAFLLDGALYFSGLSLGHFGFAEAVIDWVDRVWRDDANLSASMKFVAQFIDDVSAHFEQHEAWQSYLALFLFVMAVYFVARASDNARSKWFSARLLTALNRNAPLIIAILVITLASVYISSIIRWYVNSMVALKDVPVELGAAPIEAGDAAAGDAALAEADEAASDPAAAQASYYDVLVDTAETAAFALAIITSFATLGYILFARVRDINNRRITVRNWLRYNIFNRVRQDFTVLTFLSRTDLLNDLTEFFVYWRPDKDKFFVQEDDNFGSRNAETIFKRARAQIRDEKEKWIEIPVLTEPAGGVVERKKWARFVRCAKEVHTILTGFKDSWRNDDILSETISHDFALLRGREKDLMLAYFENYNSLQDLVNMILPAIAPDRLKELAQTKVSDPSNPSEDFLDKRELNAMYGTVQMFLNLVIVHRRLRYRLIEALHLIDFQQRYNRLAKLMEASDHVKKKAGDLFFALAEWQASVKWLPEADETPARS